MFYVLLKYVCSGQAKLLRKLFPRVKKSCINSRTQEKCIPRKGAELTNFCFVISQTNINFNDLELQSWLLYWLFSLLTYKKTKILIIVIKVMVDLTMYQIYVMTLCAFNTICIWIFRHCSIHNKLLYDWQMYIIIHFVYLRPVRYN